MDFIAYYRVSTQGQGRSGLGLEAQRSSVQAYVKDGHIIAEFTEIESGKRDDRPELAKALILAKRTGATLCVAKIDRLARSVRFLFELRESGVSIAAADLPELNTMTLAIFAALAERERELISERTKLALEAKKQRGFKLGGDPKNLNDDARRKSADVRRRLARENESNRRAAELIILYRSRGLSYREIARTLNTNGHRTRGGGEFHAQTVARLLKRSEAADVALGVGTVTRLR